MPKKLTQWDKLMKLQRRIDKLARHHQDAVIELAVIKGDVAELVSDERERIRGEKQDANIE